MFLPQNIKKHLLMGQNSAKHWGLEDILALFKVHPWSLAWVVVEYLAT
jgi:hypothetical protein